MNAKRKSLGKGLDALLSGQDRSGKSTASEAGDQMKSLPVEWLQRGEYQPRGEMDQDKLQELADSIRSQGIIQPIVVRKLTTERYEIIAGERRWRAAQIVALDTVPVIIKQVDDHAAIAIALIENIQREDLNPLEESQALQRLIEEFDLTHQQVAEAVGRSRASVSNLLRLKGLEDDVRQLLADGRIDMGHARALLSLDGDEQCHAARVVTTRGLTVRECEKLVQGWGRDTSGKRSKPAPRVDPDVARLENDLTDKLGARVNIKSNARGKGQLIISFTDAEELEGILDRIR